MTDPRTPSVTICDEEGCHVLLPNTIDDRREHRRGHLHDRKVVDALRDKLKEANETIRELKVRLAGVETDLEHIEIPEQVEPLAIVPAEELEPLDDDLDDEDAETLAAPAGARLGDVPTETVPTSPNPFTGLYTPSSNPYTGLNP